MGLSGIMKQMIKMEHNMVKNANWYWGKPVGYFTSVAEDLNSGQLRTNPDSSQSGTSTRGLQLGFKQICLSRITPKFPNNKNKRWKPLQKPQLLSTLISFMFARSFLKFSIFCVICPFF